MREALTPTQERAMDAFKEGLVLSAYEARAALPTLRALVRKGYLVDVTPRGPGAMFSPPQHMNSRSTMRRRGGRTRG